MQQNTGATTIFRNLDTNSRRGLYFDDYFDDIALSVDRFANEQHAGLSQLNQEPQGESGPPNREPPYQVKGLRPKQTTCSTDESGVLPTDDQGVMTMIACSRR